jgi:hypothetical protein
MIDPGFEVIIDPGLKSWLNWREVMIDPNWSLIESGFKSWLIEIEIMIDVGFKP